MEARSTDRKTFHLTENGQLLGELIYKNLFLHTAEIRLPNSDLYEIGPVGIFGTSIMVKKRGTEIVKLSMNWRGQIVFAFRDGQEFVFKAKGVFHNKYVIESNDEQQLLQFDPEFNWSRFNYNYDITFGKKPQDTLFVLLGVYASNYYIASMSGVIAGTA